MQLKKKKKMGSHNQISLGYDTPSVTHKIKPD